MVIGWEPVGLTGSSPHLIVSVFLLWFYIPTVIYTVHWLPGLGYVRNPTKRTIEVQRVVKTRTKESHRHKEIREDNIQNPNVVPNGF